MFVVASVIYRPIEQLLSRTIADRRARGLTGEHNLRVPLLIQARVRADVPRHRARAARPAAERPLRRLGRAVLGARRRRPGLRGELLRARLPGRPPALRALRPARVPGGDVAGLLRACGRRRDRVGPVGRRARHGRRAAHVAARRAVVLRAPRPAGRSRRGQGARGRPDDASRPRFRGRGLRDHARRADAAQRGRADRRGHRRRRGAGGHRLQRAAHRARPAAALSGRPGLAAAASRRAAGDGRRRGVSPRDPDHGAGDRRLRAGGRDRPVRDRAAGRARAVRHRPRHRARRPGARRAGDGLSPRRRYAQPGRARPRPGARRRGGLAAQRGGVRHLDAQPGHRRPAAAHRGRLLLRDGGAQRHAGVCSACC